MNPMKMIAALLGITPEKVAEMLSAFQAGAERLQTTHEIISGQSIRIGEIQHQITELHETLKLFREELR